MNIPSFLIKFSCQLGSVFFLFLILFFCPSCTNPQDGNRPKANDTLIVAQDVKGPFVLDSLLFDSLSTATPELAPYHLLSRNFYSNRKWAYAWFSRSGLREHAGFLLQFLEGAKLEGVRDSFPLLPYLQERMNIYANADSGLAPDPVFETAMTQAFFWYADKAWTGLPEEKSKAMGWFLPRHHVDKTEWLDSAISHSPDGSLLSNAVFRQYYWLRNYLVRYDSVSRAGGWPQVGYPGYTLRYGVNDSVVPRIAESLRLHGDLDSAGTGTILDSACLKGAMKFQERHGLNPDGALGKEFFSALNVSVEERIEQILINMERSRWMPSGYPLRYLIVNIPDFSLYAYDEGKQIWTMRVVVGKEMHETTVFSGMMKYVVFNPYWVIPPGILYKEIIPGVMAKSSYLNKHNMEVVDAGGNKVSTSGINWSKYSQGGFPYTIRQKPGTTNSLGKVKFLFPNNYSIYLHDTPSRSLFKEEKRAFSHGCIRLSDPEKLANFVLAPEGHSPEKIEKWLKPGKETWVTMKKELPVYIVYFTAWVENDGQLHFRKDIYQRDQKLRQELLSVEKTDSLPATFQ
ncbi:MAG: L,D-transpeptidase family protein [Bacteroidia bacterium]|nr:L,D-transpeptidase family protein [Bacteroidia bacterium]